LVRLCPDCLRDAGRSAPHAIAWHLRTAELGIGQHADRGVRLLLDLRLARGAAAEPAIGESAAAFDEVDELRLGDAPNRVFLTPLARRRKERRLNLVERARYGADDVLDRRWCLPTRALRQHDLSTRQIARPDFQPHGHPECLPFEILRPGLHGVAEIELHTSSSRSE